MQSDRRVPSQRKAAFLVIRLIVAIYGGDPAWHGFVKFQTRKSKTSVWLHESGVEAVARVGFLSFSGHEAIFAIEVEQSIAMQV